MRKCWVELPLFRLKSRIDPLALNPISSIQNIRCFYLPLVTSIPCRFSKNMPEVDYSISAKSVQRITLIYDSYASVMYGVALKMVKNQALAEKILNLAFVHIKEKNLDYKISQQNICFQLINIIRTIVRNTVEFSFENNSIDRSANNESILEKNNKIKVSNAAFATIQHKQKVVLDDLFFGNETISSAALKLSLDEREVMKLLRETINQIRTITEKENDH